MANFNDAEITSLYVSAVGTPDVENDAPNAPGGGAFSVTMEMVAGGALTSQQYTLVTTCSNVSQTTAASALNPPAGPLNGDGKFNLSPWTGGPQTYVFNQAVTITPATPGNGNVYQYTAALYDITGQVVSTKQSDLFILL